MTFPVLGAYDVIICGGGTAGVVAAIQAGRAGAKTLLVEKAGMLGGTITAGGINYPGLFYAWQRQVIAGIGWELVTRCLEECGQSLPEPSFQFARRHGLYHIPVDRAVFTALCDEFVLAAGVEILLHTMLAGMCRDGEDWRVTLCTKTGLADVTAPVVIDCTGDANATALAGFPLVIPDECQPLTQVYHVSGFDPDALDLDALNSAAAQAIQAGTLRATDVGWNTQEPNFGHWVHKAGENANHIHHINARDSQGRTQAELEGRKSFLRLYRFLRTCPEFATLAIDYLAPECGVRETATIVGKATVTETDYVTGRVWDDAVCYSFYPIDLHTSAGGGIHGHPLQEGAIPTIPRGAMLPVNSTNFIVAGRCIASDRIANSALRVQATAMAIGQAAGALAALAVHAGTSVEAVPMEALYQLLRAHGAVIPGELPAPLATR